MRGLGVRARGQGERMREQGAWAHGFGARVGERAAKARGDAGWGRGDLIRAWSPPGGERTGRERAGAIRGRSADATSEADRGRRDTGGAGRPGVGCR